MTNPNLKIDYYKLETEFRDDCVIHATYEWDLSTRLRQDSTWRKRKRIGEGTFGSVWLEREEERGHLRAVKKLRRNQAQADFAQELRALAKLREHNHLFVEFFGWYENTDKIFLAMEYVQHGDLSEYIKDRDKAKMNAKEITRQLLEGLEVLHEKGICHRDLKPQNVLVASSDPIWVKIADFGVSKRTKNTALRTRCGTMAYQAPELNGLLPAESNSGQEYTNALDIWSLGCLVHEILSSQTPFLGELPEVIESGCSTFDPEIDIGLLYQYCRDPEGFPIRVLQNSQVSEEGIDFVKSLLRADPKRRPSAICASQDPWLARERNDWYEGLRSEFLSLGVELNLGDRDQGILIKQKYKADILRFLPYLAEANFPVLLQDAVSKRLGSAFLMLLRSPSAELVDFSTRRGLLRRAIKVRCLNTLKLLLDNKVDSYARIDNQKMLRWAAEAGHVGAVKLLLDNHINVDSSNIDIQTVVQWAVKSGHVDVLRLLLKKKVDVNVHGTVLRVGAEGGHIDMVRLLLKNYHKLGFRPKMCSQKAVALNTAAAEGHTDVVKLLLENGASVDPTALMEAAGGGHTDVVELLLKSGASVNSHSSFSPTALQAAASRGHTDVVKLLLKNGASANIRSSRNRTALQGAAARGHIDTVKLLLENGASIDICSGRNQTALQAAAAGGHTDVVKLLLESGASSANNHCDFSPTALQAAAVGGHTDVVKLLLEDGVSVGSTALGAAAGGGHTDVVKLLLENGASVDVYSGYNRTVLQGAAAGGHIDTVKLLLENRASIDIYSSYGRTALQAAAAGGYADAVKLLLENGASIDICSGRNQTALQAAAAGGHTDVVKLLLESGASSINNHCGFSPTALQAAVSGGHTDVVKLLSEGQVSASRYETRVNSYPTIYIPVKLL